MASRKRSRLADDSGDEVDIESASSSFRSSLPKRPRATLAAEQGGSTVSDEDEDDAHTSSRYSSLAPTELPADSDDEDEAIDEVRGTQVVEKQYKQLKENVAMEQGIIEEVFCRNFMCHSKLRIKLGPLINFIIGHNGSGKSAVLTALTMCLGGKATTTNRGSSLKSMIKEGEENATLAVKIKNQGDGAYKPDLYGRSITVERNFSRSGVSGFKIKNSEDRIVSTRKSDLDDIIDFFALQLDNPINVLNQDMARQFLSNSTPTEKYKFFIRGTQLETLDQDYKLLEEHLDNTEVKLKSREDDLTLFKAKADEAERKKTRLDASTSIEREVQKLQRMHAWAQVEEQEELLRQYQSSVTAAGEKVDEAVRAAEDAGSTYEGHMQTHEQAQRFANDLEQELEPLKDNLASRKNEFDNGRNEIIESQTQRRHAKDEYKNAQSNKSTLEQHITEEQARLADAEGGERSEILDRLTEAKKAVELAKIDISSFEEMLPTLERKRLDASKAVDDAKQPLVDQRQAVEKAEALLTRLQREQDRRFSAYNQHMESLVQAVDGETRWRSKPLGPVGLHLRVKKPQWTFLFEKTFGGVLESFAVSCREDQILLSSIMRRIGCSFNIFVNDPTPLDTTGKEPEEGVDTMLRVLDIDNDLIRNQLIINQAIEQTVLIRDRQEAHDYLYGDIPPQNVKAVIAFDGGERGNGVRFDFTKSGAPKSSSVAAWTGPSRMQTNREEQIKHQQEKVVQAKRELDGSQQNLRRLQHALEQAKQEIAKTKKRRHEFIAREQSLTDDVEAMQEQIEKNKPQDGRLQELQRQLEQAEEDEGWHRTMVEDLTRAKVNLDETQRESKARMDAAQAEVDSQNQRIAKAKTNVDRLDDERQAALKEKNEAFEAVNDAKTNLQSRAVRRDKQQELVTDDFVAAAEKICARVPVENGVTPDMLDARLTKFIKDLEKCQQEAGGTRETLTAAWKKAKTELHDAERQFRSMKKVSRRLKTTLTHRKHRWKMFRRFIGVRARINFTYLLSERQFRGDVLLDHEGKMLDIKVEPDLSKVSDAGREARTLSGGEKSFSTICLLLSIWEAMGSPIRCLDEFDVFMDSVNRATSMTMMIQAARRSVGRQYILITPQSMQNVQLGDDVKIHRMSDPERGQLTLPYTQS